MMYMVYFMCIVGILRACLLGGLLFSVPLAPQVDPILPPLWRLDLTVNHKPRHARQDRRELIIGDQM